MKHARGLTLIEILLVVSAIAILASIVIVATNPARTMSDVRDTWRHSTVVAIDDAIIQYQIANDWVLPGDKEIPTGSENAIPICQTGVQDTFCVNLDDLSPEFLSSDIPLDVSQTANVFSGFTVYKDNSGRTKVEAQHLATAPWTQNDTEDPYHVAFYPSDNYTDTSAIQNLRITFNEDTYVGTGEDNNITIYHASDDSVFETFDAATSDRISGSGSRYIYINPTESMIKNVEYYVQIGQDAFDDAYGNFFPPIEDKTTWNFTIDYTDPVISQLVPSDGDTDVSAVDDLRIWFSEGVDGELGFDNDITIYRASDDSVVEVIDAQSAKVTGGTTSIKYIDPDTDLVSGVEYYIQIGADAFDDDSINSFAGISDTTTWNFTVDSTPPTITGFAPADGATSVLATTDLIFSFSEEVDAESFGDNDIVIKRVSDDVTVQTIDAQSGKISGSGTDTITIDIDDLVSDTQYYVQIESDAFDDDSTNSFAGISDTTTWNFHIEDTTPPTITSTSPEDDAIDVAYDGDFTIQFDEEVVAQSGANNDITIYRSSDDTIVEVIDAESVQVSGSTTSTITVSPSVSLSSQEVYYVLIGSDAFNDDVGNDFAGISDSTVWNFTVEDIINPSLSSTTPTDNATDVSVSDNLTMTMSENVQAGSGNILLRRTSDNAIIETIPVVSGMISGDTVTINPSSNLASETGYYITVASGAIEDLSGNPYAGFTDTTTWNFTTADIINPSLSSTTPTDNATDVSVSDNLTMTMSENVQAGSGNILLRRTSDNAIIETIPVVSGMISGDTVTINPSSNLASETGYYITVASGAIEDLSGNPYAGFTDTTIWNFTTADIINPSLSSTTPTDNATDVAVDANIVLTMSENVVAGTGNIGIYETDGDSLVENISISPGMISGDTVTINPTSDLDGNTEYYVLVASTALDDTSGNSYAGISSTTALSFTTVE